MEHELSTAAAEADGNVVELRHTQTPAWAKVESREITPEDWRRYECHLAKIFGAMGMDPDTPGAAHAAPVPARAARGDGGVRRRRASADGVPGPERPPQTDGRHSQDRRGPDLLLRSLRAPCAAVPRLADVAYVAGGEIVGISKLTRLVRLYARRFTVQERLGEQIADTLVRARRPARAWPCTWRRRISARRCAASTRRARRTTTTFWRGSFHEDGDLRREFLDEVRGRSRR